MTSEYRDETPDDRDPSQKILDELFREARKANKEDLEIAGALEGLIRHPGWKVYVERVLGPRIQAFGEGLLSPLAKMDAILGQEYLKGAMSGLIIARDLPPVIIAAMKEIPAHDTEE